MFRCRVERGKVSAEPAGARLWDMPSPAVQGSWDRKPQVLERRVDPAGDLCRVARLNKNRERELGLDRRETG